MTVSSTLIIKKGLTCILGGFGKSSGTANRVAGRCISTVNATELQFYDQQSTSDWWDRKHPFWALQRYNRLRVPFIERHIARYGRKTLAEARVLDVGCGGGYLSEALAREGATVTGIDASSRAIEVAEGHRQKELVDALLSTKEKQGLERLSYFQADVDSISAQDQSFDVVVASEVVEHVDHVSHFLRRCTALLKPGGLLVITTPNRTPLAYISVIFMAEYVLKLLPKGTHKYSKCIKPSELRALCEQQCGLQPLEYAGALYLVPPIDTWIYEPTGAIVVSAYVKNAGENGVFGNDSNVFILGQSGASWFERYTYVRNLLNYQN